MIRAHYLVSTKYKQVILNSINLRVDFEHKILDGTVTLKLTSITDIDKVILDTTNDITSRLMV